MLTCTCARSVWWLNNFSDFEILNVNSNHFDFDEPENQEKITNETEN